MAYQDANVEVLDKAQTVVQQPPQATKKQRVPRRLIRSLPSIIYDLHKRISILQEELKKARKRNQTLRERVAHAQLPENKTGLYWE